MQRLNLTEARKELPNILNQHLTHITHTNCHALLPNHLATLKSDPRTFLVCRSPDDCQNSFRPQPDRRLAPW
jgi:hypothetical protein